MPPCKVLKASMNVLTAVAVAAVPILEFMVFSFVSKFCTKLLTALLIIDS